MALPKATQQVSGKAKMKPEEFGFFKSNLLSTPSPLPCPPPSAMVWPPALETKWEQALFSFKADVGADEAHF